METKYYTPTIEEFHVGFEFQRKEEHRLHIRNEFPKTNKWTLKKWDENQIRIGKLRCEINEGNIRVKELDQEDLESLGWKMTKNFNYEIQFQFIINDYKFYDCSYDFEDKILLIEEFIQEKLVANTINNYNSYTLFKGEIKNKSELKRIMKQLQIWEQ